MKTIIHEDLNWRSRGFLRPPVISDLTMAEAMMIKLEELGVGVWVTKDSKVVRGHDWCGGDADGEGEGTVTKVDGKNGVVSVRWENGNYGYYRMGAGGKFELKMAPKPIVERTPAKVKEIESESEYETEEEEEVIQTEIEPVKVESVVKTPSKCCEYCGGVWTENNLSSSICVDCTAKLWRGEIVNRNNEFEKYDKIAFIRL